MKLIACSALLLVAGAARADDARAALHDALETQAAAPATPPKLPDSASDRAKYVQQNIAHGKKGEAERAAHAHDDADAARTDDATKSAQGAAASAAKSANADSHAAAGQAQATKARGGKVPGSGGPNGHPHGPPADHPH